MNIVMMTNTYLPMLGGVARSVAWFSEAFRQQGHRVLVVAPTFENMPHHERDVVRMPALQKFNGSDFSVRIPIPGLVDDALDEFRPDIVHSHHPFLLGDTALRVAALYDLPIVFTHHTMYEQYTHYVPGDSPAIKRFVIRLATEYANLCDHVIAPSESIADVLRQRGVTVPITSIPTGIDKNRFATGDGAAARRQYGIDASAFVVGHVGRLAPEKNLALLARAVAQFATSHPHAHFLVVGKGPSEEDIQSIFAERGLSDRLHMTGSLDGQPLTDAYHAMDVFAFASKSETQGMVLAEAMTAGSPVVAIDAPGAREVVRDGENGRLLPTEDESEFAAALSWIHSLPQDQRSAMCQTARKTAEEFAMPRCAERVLEIYQSLIAAGAFQTIDDAPWSTILRCIEEEWNIWTSVRHAVTDALFGPEEPEQRPGELQ
jgi:glycosyltransferase involved in cell wall biosynthesis